MSMKQNSRSWSGKRRSERLGKHKRGYCLEILEQALRATLIRLRVKVRLKTKTEAIRPLEVQARLGQANVPHVTRTRDILSVLDARMALPGTIRLGTLSGPSAKETNVSMTIVARVSSATESVIVLGTTWFV